MNKRLLILLIAVVLGVSAFAAACGGTATTTTSAAATTETTAMSSTTTAGGTGTTAGGTGTTTAASGQPIKIGFDGGFTSFMAYDVQMADQGIQTALAMLNNQWQGRPLQYVKEDNASDPTTAVDKARKMVEQDKIDVMIGPIYSPSAKAVADYLGKSSGIPQMSIVGQPAENLETANGLAFIHTGFFDSHGYYFGKYLAEQGYKTANVINYEDTPAHALTAGFKKAFVDEGGGQVLSENYIDISTVDFSSYLTTMKPADVTVFWIFGNGAVPFVQQYYSYGLTAPLAAPMSNNFTDEQLAEIGDQALGMLACDYYAYTVDNPQNKEFVAAYQKLFNSNPPPQAYGAWQGVMLYLDGLQADGGDTTPANVIPAIANLSIDTPAGHVQIVPYTNSSYPNEKAYIAKRDFFILSVQKVGDTLTWVPVKIYNNVLLGTLADMP
jgi:branched-chain amino acid transport system substrate-binding protein